MLLPWMTRVTSRYLPTCSAESKFQQATAVVAPCKAMQTVVFLAQRQQLGLKRSSAMQTCRQSLQRTYCRQLTLVISVGNVQRTSVSLERNLAVRTRAAAAGGLAAARAIVAKHAPQRQPRLIELHAVYAVEKHYAVVGAGLAGLATVYHLLVRASNSTAQSLQLAAIAVPDVQFLCC